MDFYSKPSVLSNCHIHGGNKQRGGFLFNFGPSPSNPNAYSRYLRAKKKRIGKGIAGFLSGLENVARYIDYTRKVKK